MKRLLLLLFIAVSFSCADTSALKYRPYNKISSEEKLRIYNEEIERSIVYAPHQNLEKLRDEAHKYAFELFSRAQEKYNLPKKELSDTKWYCLLKRAGYAVHDEKSDKFYIVLDEIMFLRNYGDFFSEVIPHEITHLVLKLEGIPFEQHHSLEKFKEVTTYIGGRFTLSHHMDSYPSCILHQRLNNPDKDPCHMCSFAIIPHSCEEYRKRTNN